MKQRVLLVSKDDREGRSLIRQITSFSGFEVFLESDAKTVLYRMKHHDLDAVVMNLNQFGITQVKLIDQIKAQKYKFKIIILADRVQPMAYMSVEDMANVAVLSKSLINVEKDFLGFLKRAITQDKIAKRSAKRHLSRQVCMVKHIRTGETMNAMISNLSKTGAFLEFPKGQLNILDKVQIIIPLNELNKIRALTAVVMWFELHKNGARTAGVRFLGPSFSTG